MYKVEIVPREGYSRVSHFAPEVASLVNDRLGGRTWNTAKFATVAAWAEIEGVMREKGSCGRSYSQHGLTSLSFSVWLHKQWDSKVAPYLAERL